MRFRTTVSVVVALLAVLATGVATAQERFGGIAGVVTDSSQAPVPGATITATNKQTGALASVVSGTDGRIGIPDLEPGRYTVTVELQGFQKVQADDVLVLLGRTADFPAVAESRRRQRSRDRHPATPKKQVDLRSTTVAHNVTAEEFDRMPKARSFQGIALTSPGVNQGDVEGGFQVNGASGAENSFTVDGVNTNSLLYGSSRQDTVFEYLQEVQVKTGGIAAEYGGALGGVISAVTKSGGNRFTGEVTTTTPAAPFRRGRSSGFSSARSTTPPSSTCRTTKQKNNRNEVGGSIGGPIVKDNLFFFGSISPRFVRRDQRLPLLERHRARNDLPERRPRRRRSGRSRIASRRMQANGSVLSTPIRSDGHTVSLRRHRAAVHQQLARRQRRPDSPGSTRIRRTSAATSTST